MHALVPRTSLPSPPLGSTASYPALLERLNRMSVHKAHDPYLDIDWDAPEHALSPEDPRVCLPADHPLVQSDWYAGLDDRARGHFALEWTAQILRFGISFEAVLSRGLLEFAQTVGNRSPEYRYAMHEVVEEGRHSLMFHEVIRRSGCDPQPVTGFDRFMDDRIAHLGRTFPELFFIAVLGGEIFIDQQNRELLRRPRQSVHPLLRRVMQIHVTEEARHVCFAENYLREHLPRLSGVKRELLAFATPVVLSESQRMMLVPDARITARFGIPRATLKAAFGPGTPHRALVAATVAPLQRLCEEHRVLQPRHRRAWRVFGLLLD